MYVPRSTVYRCVTQHPSASLPTPHLGHASLIPARQLQPHMDERHLHPAISSQPFAATTSSSVPSFQLLSLLPPPLLALVASHLDVRCLLRLQRCSSVQHRLRADESYMAVAWRWAELTLSTHTRLHEWTLPYEQCIDGGVSPSKHYIPVSMWRAALPAFQAAVAETTENPERYESCELLETLIQREQPTRWIMAKPDQNESWKVVDDESLQQPDVQRVEVLAEVDWWHLHRDVAPQYGTVDVRCRLVLRACPYLQHLDLAIDSFLYVPPSHEDTFALVPCLRSLRLSQADSDQSTYSGEVVDFLEMLDSLPHLTSLSCNGVRYLAIVDLLDIVSHSTLEELDINSDEASMAEWKWIGFSMEFPISVEDDERALEREAMYNKLDGDIVEESEVVAATVVDDASGSRSQLTGTHEGESGSEELRVEMQRMRAALTRTQPTERSCRVRLALADWLHRRLRRGKLPTDNHDSFPDHSKSQLRRYRKQVALLRSVLQGQVSELPAQSTSTARSASETLTAPSEPNAASRPASAPSAPSSLQLGSDPGGLASAASTELPNTGWHFGLASTVKSVLGTLRSLWPVSTVTSALQANASHSAPSSSELSTANKRARVA